MTQTHCPRWGGLSIALVVWLGMAGSAAAQSTSVFAGVKVNGGTASHRVENGVHYLALSNDFETPDTPDPHWQVVDSEGTSYRLERLEIKGDVFHREIALPTYVPDVARVQIWCAFAETLLGEATFAKPVSTERGVR